MQNKCIYIFPDLYCVQSGPTMPHFDCSLSQKYIQQLLYLFERCSFAGDVKFDWKPLLN